MTQQLPSNQTETRDFLKKIIPKLARSKQDILKNIYNSNISFLNPYSFLQLHNQKHLIENIDIWGIDGISLVKILNKKFNIECSRISFDYTSIAHEIFEKISIEDAPIFITGSTEKSIQKFKLHLKYKYPEIEISGVRNGYYANLKEQEECIHEILNSQTAVVLCGMGTPNQEAFLNALRNRGWQGGALTCGGFIHQTAQSSDKYYPKWIDNFNLRFAYRVWDEPKLIKRYLIDYPKAIKRILIDAKDIQSNRL